MFVVILSKPIPGVRSTTFVFFNQLEAEEFQSCVCAFHSQDGVTVTLEPAGEAKEVFPAWSF